MRERERVFKCACVCVCVRVRESEKYVCISLILLGGTPRVEWRGINNWSGEGLQHCAQGGEDAQNALSCRSLSAKKPRIIGLFCGK